MMRLERDLKVRTSWEDGPAAGSHGPFFISYTEFTPRYAADVVPIYLSASHVRSADWWSDSFDLAQAFSVGQSALEEGESAKGRKAAK